MNLNDLCFLDFLTTNVLKNLIATSVNPSFKRSEILHIFPFIDFTKIQQELIRRMDAIDSNQTSQAMIQLVEKGTSNKRWHQFFGSCMSPDSQDVQNLPNAVIDSNFFMNPNDDFKRSKIREIFTNLNTKMLSSASVERLFSVAKKFWTFDLPNLSDKTLEHMIFVKENKNIF